MQIRNALLFVLTCALMAHAEVASHSPATQPGGKASANVLEDKYDNGKVKARYALSPDGVKWGAYTLYSEDGKVVERGSYNKGQLDGQRKVYYPSGQVKTIETYRMGTFDGPHQLYYENGHAQLQENFKAGRRDGVLQEFDATGHMVHAAKYRVVMKDGKAIDSEPLADQTNVNGILVYPRSREMIERELAQIEATKVPMAAPSAAIPEHDGTGDRPQAREDAVRRLMDYRYLSYVPYENMALDPVYCAHDEAASAILKVIGKLDHGPPNPGWPPTDRYKYAYAGTSHSNLYAAGGGANMCRDSINAYMNDSGGDKPALGHRRWCLNPVMGKVGIASSGHYSAMWAMDSSRRPAPDFDYIAYPAAGPYPTTYFRASYAWSVSLNEQKYQRPNYSDVKVTVTPVEVQILANTIKPLGKAMTMKFAFVNSEGYGIPNCIIFQPSGVEVDDGKAYSVEITGLKSNRGNGAASITYVVDFFKPGEKKMPEMMESGSEPTSASENK